MSLYFKIKRSLFPNTSHYPAFMSQFRLEARSRDANDETALEMRTADPLWMLARQWQFGEFRGEDNGSPISVRANFRKEKTTTYNFPNSDQPKDLGKVPLEARVEAIEVRPMDLKSKVRIGQKMEALIRAKFSRARARNMIRNLRREFRLSPEKQLDRKSRRFFELMMDAVIDGGALWEKIQAGDFPYGGLEELEEVTQQLKSWYQNLFLPAGKDKAWQSHQLLHQFSVQGEAGTNLNAPDFQSGHLDWYAFDTAEVTLDPIAQTQMSEDKMPTNVSFAAMPNKRLFSFEDSHLDLSGMEVEPTDLVRLMIIDFSLVSGTDWFTIPLQMKVGELCWVNHLKVKDVFGVTTVINNKEGQFLDNNPLKVWDAFKIRSQNTADFDPRDHFLYLTPATTARKESPPLEELLFLRDEYANMVWAIEKKVLNEMGQVVDGFDLHLELNGPFTKNTDEEETTTDGNTPPPPKFRLASPVPTNWIPYLPRHIGDSEHEIELVQALMVRNEADEEPVDINPLSWLAGEDLSAIREEAIPRAGIRIQLTKQRVRWADGKTYIWLGRKVLTGKGEGSSGLTFDQLV